MSIEFRTVDDRGVIYRVTDLFDRHGHATTDPELAVSCVIHTDECLWATTTDDVPIYTVH